MDATTTFPAASPAAPFTLSPLFDNIPAELRAYKNWIVWAHTWKDGEKKFAKVPYSPATNTPASSTDPTTWGSFEEAVAAYTLSRVKGDPNDALDGIGFVFTGTPFMGVDLDHVLTDSVLTAEAHRIVGELNTYTEVSPSGCGVKAIMKGEKPGNGWSKITGLGLEMYDEGRYFTVTGHVLDGVPAEPQERQAQVDALYWRTLSEKGSKSAPPAPTTTTTPPMPDDVVIEKVMKSAQAGKFQKLMAGDLTGYPGESEADYALIGVLAFWTQDAEQIERIMRRSKLVREKWDTSRPGGTYLSTSIENALESVVKTYSPETPRAADLGLMRLSDVEMVPVPWLWPGYLPLGAVSLLVGDAGLGKTLVAFDLAARVTTGAAWPDGIPNTHRGDVLILSAEDSASYTIRPRIEAAGGDSSRVHILNVDTAIGGLSLTKDVLRLEAALNEHAIKFVVIDPLSAYMPGIDTYRDNEVRSTLAPFVAVAERCGTTVLAIIHMSKNIERNAMQRILGSVAFNALARASYMVARDPDAGRDEHRRLFVHVKMNLGPAPAGLVFEPTGTKVGTAEGREIPSVYAKWETGTTVKTSADEIVRQLARGPAATKELDDALRDLLKDGPVLATDATEKLGKSEPTLRRARERLRVVSIKDPADTQHGAYYWLPPDWPKADRDAWEGARMALREPPKPV